MKPSFFFANLTIIFFALCFSIDAHSQEKKEDKKKGDIIRYYYDFLNKKIVNAPNSDVEVESPIQQKAGKDIKIEMFNYNPLKDEIITENSSSDRFLADTAKIAGFISFPKIGNIPQSDIAAAAKTTTDKMKPIASPVIKTDCQILADYMEKLNLQKDKIEEAIRIYKGFMNQVDLISDDYDFLKSLETLRAATITEKLRDNFVTNLNNYLTYNNKATVNTSPVSISSTQISTKEQEFYKAIIDEEKVLDQIQKEVDNLKGGCPDFLDIYKKFNSKVAEIKTGLKDFKNDYTTKVYPGFKKTLTLFEKLKVYAAQEPRYVTNAITVESDMHSIKVYKKAVGSDSKIEYDVIHIEPIKGWKLDVAGGFFFSGLNDNAFTKTTQDSIYTKQYLVNGVRRDTTVQEKFTAFHKEDQSHISFGGMLLLHAHTQSPRMINYGFYLGFGALFNDQTRWAGSFGGSLLIGKKQRFNINPGILVSQVDRLSNPYQTEKWYPGVIDNIPKYRSWKLGWVIAFSWNIK